MSVQMLPAPFELECGGPIGESGDMTCAGPSVPLADLCARCMSPALDLLIMLAETMIKIDGCTYISCVVAANEKINEKSFF